MRRPQRPRAAADSLEIVGAVFRSRTNAKSSRIDKHSPYRRRFDYTNLPAQHNSVERRAYGAPSSAATAAWSRSAVRTRTTPRRGESAPRWIAVSSRSSDAIAMRAIGEKLPQSADVFDLGVLSDRPKRLATVGPWTHPCGAELIREQRHDCWAHPRA